VGDKIAGFVYRSGTHGGGIPGIELPGRSSDEVGEDACRRST
jgi:hypothetical protein